MEYVTIGKLTELLKTVMPQRDYRSAGVFLQRKIFNDKNNKKVVNVCADTSWAYIDDYNALSELSRAKIDKNLSPQRLAYAVTALTVFYYKGVLRDIEADISSDLRQLNEQETNALTEGLINLQDEGKLPLFCEYDICGDDLAKAIVACVIHGFYIDSPKVGRVKNAYSKGNALILKHSGVKQDLYERDFPLYKYTLSWEELDLTDDCKYCKCSRCKHKCVNVDSNYNVEQLLKLYLNLNVNYNQDDEDMTDEFEILDAMIDALSSEAKSKFIKTIVRKHMSPTDQTKYAVDLLTNDKKNKKNGEKEN